MELPVKDNTKVVAMLEQMGKSVEELRSSDAWLAMLKVQARFHKYSASNQLMIYMQRPDSTQVAGFRQWQGMGRQVQKGEKGIKIFAPMTVKDKVTDDKKLVGFKIVNVFDVSQTQGEPLPIIPWPEAGDCPEGLYDQLVEQAAALGFPVTEERHDMIGPAGARAWYSPSQRTITIRPMSEAGQAAAILHELGHALDPFLMQDNDHARKELVAESAAYILGTRFGIAIEEEVTHYLASWKGDIDSLLAIVDRVKQIVMAFERSPLLSGV